MISLKMSKLKNILFTIILFNLCAFSFCTEAIHSVTIVGTYNKPISFSNNRIIKWQSDSYGEYVEIVVHGKIFDFEVIQVEMTNGSLVELSQKYFIKEVENNSIVLSTVLVEGIPSEKIKWKDSKANEYEYFINDYNSGIDTETHTFYIK